jgi:heat shock protein HslJ
MNKKRVFSLLQLILILVLSGNYSLAQNYKTAQSSATKNKSFSKTGDLLAQRWNLIEINGLPVRNASPFIEFNSTEKRFAGNAGCNQMFGTFEVNENTIKLSGIGSTRMFCSSVGVMKMETDLVKALQQATRFEQKGNTLNLYAQNNLILKFLAANNKSGNGSTSGVKLEDKKWILTAIAAKCVQDFEEKPFLVFNKKQSSAVGNSGCNHYSGKYKSTGSKISITGIIQTMKACAENERMNVERQMLDALKQTNRFEIKTGKLNLYRANKLLLSFEGASKE